MPPPKTYEEELRVLSRSGFLTKSLWQEFIYRGASQGGMHHGWASLLKEPHFELHPNPYLKNVAILNRRSRALQKLLAGQFASPPPESLFRHDETCLRGVLEIESHGFLADWRLEAGLKSSGMQTYRIESAGSLVKYPDAILEFGGKERSLNVAVEVELTQKSQRRYDQIINCYSFMKDVAMVLFVTRNRAIESALKRAAKDSFYPAYGIKLGFMDLPGWHQSPVLSDIEVNGRRLSLGAWVELELGN